MFGVERFTVLKLAAVIAWYVFSSVPHTIVDNFYLHSFSGVVLVSLSDSQPATPLTPSPSPRPPLLTLNHAQQPLFGDALALISALFYAFYVIFLKVKVKVESRIDMRLFLGFVGLFDLLTCWPVGMILHWTGMEKLELPGTATQWYALLINVCVLLPCIPYTIELIMYQCRWQFLSLVTICTFSPC